MTEENEKWEHYEGGPSVTRDPETGYFVKAHLDSETARQLGQMSKGVKERAKRSGELAENFFAIVEDRISPDKKKAVRGVVNELARIATENKSSAAVQAVQHMLNLIGEYGTKAPKPNRGEKCPLCGEVVGGQVVNVSLANNIDALNIDDEQWGAW